jgi:hypothetical protein
LEAAVSEQQTNADRELADLPELKDYRTFPGAARMLGVSRSRISQMVTDPDPAKRLPAVRVPDSRTGLIHVDNLERIKRGWADEARARAEALSR